ncbi:hypothetical protein GIB67_039723 [Kingdonia uniflora]|uniref:Multidrug resistance protein ABC transporter family protein n=1 Tax=Kingdonia uniflora TaxID=39325 RepID=A0A7J7MQC1_9MAGN|nr:hypothetical protein GIB67_039723 [Kingdonia uniflora]
MGNHSSHSSTSTGKVVLSDGSVHEFDRPITVAELMLEHPQQVVVEFREIISGNKPTPLPADRKLDRKKTYLMVPMKRGKAVNLSAREARIVFLKAKSVLRSGSLLSIEGIVPWVIRMCQAQTGTEFVHKTLHKHNGLAEKPELSNDKLEFLTEIFDQRPEFLSKQFSGKGWKPSLDTITETVIKQKASHWLF